jgi:nicotinamidase-related amidase
MSKKVHLVIIDGQKDFCDPKGSLYVAGAEEDCKRVGAMISRLKDQWDDISITFDSHNFVHIAHPCYWKDNKGNHPTPFTTLVRKQIDKDQYIIVAAEGPDLKPGNVEFSTVRTAFYKRGLSYLEALEKNNRYKLTIWPPHCLIGTTGWTLMDDLMKPLLDWEADFNKVEKITKGSNLHTEHYSAVRADVIDPQDPSTQMNTPFIQSLMEADLVAICGQASSHCLANTVRDVVSTFKDEDAVGKIVLLTDGTSPVPGFEHLTKAFIDEMTTGRTKAGKTPMKLAKCAEFLS